MHSISSGQEFYDTSRDMRFTVIEIFPDKDYVEIETEDGDTGSYGLSDLHEAIRDEIIVLEEDGEDDTDEAADDNADDEDSEDDEGEE